MYNFTPFFAFFLSLFFLPFSVSAQQAGCSCLDCPLPITDNSVTYSSITISGAEVDDLSECPLVQVCLGITHSWIGDLSASLISPGGQQYLIMADLNNSNGGCGAASDNIEVCINTGTDNPLTNNTDYVCNGTNPCLVGNWTVPCGGITDHPQGMAVEAPNCDLNDFNLPGQPVNGLWTLVVRDVCPQDVGTLDHWELLFACDIDECDAPCTANGGLLNIDTIIGCAPALSLDIEPEYAPGEEPTIGHLYTFVYTVGDTILGLVNEEALGTIGSGIFQVCGLSYRPDEEAELASYVGQPLDALQNDLADTTLNICADLSDDCFTLILHAPIAPTFIDTIICENECIPRPNGTYCCEPGICELVYQAENGCDSLVYINIMEVLEVSSTADSALICPGDSVMIGGQFYYEAGIYIDTLQAANGCDSISYVEIAEIPIDLTLSQDLFTLTANQANAQYQWIDCELGEPIAGAVGQSFTATSNGVYGVYITLGDCTVLSDCVELTTVGAQEHQALPFSIYPNPGDGAYTLELPEAARVVITDVLGVPVFEGDMPFGKSLLDLTALPAGSYHLQVEMSSGIYGRLLVKR